jgi:hypothetical protein
VRPVASVFLAFCAEHCPGHGAGPFWNEEGFMIYSQTRVENFFTKYQDRKTGNLPWRTEILVPMNCRGRGSMSQEPWIKTKKVYTTISQLPNSQYP